MLKNWLYILIITLLVGSCKEQEIKQYPQVYDYGYFPLDAGLWREYEVTSIVIDVPSNLHDTIQYQLREVYGGWMLNAANDSIMRIDRFIRDSSHHSWQPYGVWQASINENNAMQTEENRIFIKLKFPVSNNLNWNGDAYNRLDTLEEYRYTIASLDVPETINNLSFDSVLTVMQKNKITLIDKVYYFEKFAYGLGLIEKQQVDVVSQGEDVVDPNIPIENRITKGTVYYQIITRYGRN